MAWIVPLEAAMSAMAMTGSARSGSPSTRAPPSGVKVAPFSRVAMLSAPAISAADLAPPETW